MIKSIDELAEILGESVGTIEYLARTAANGYRCRDEPKPDGGTRRLAVPGPRLMALQGLIKDRVLRRVAVHPCVHGSGQRRNIGTHATPHLRKEWVIASDIRKFYPSVRHHAVRGLYREMGLPKRLSALLTRLTTFDGSLPQGAPSSAYIGNLILYPVDADTHAYCLERGMRYTRFADDIAVSANYDCRHHWPQISEFFVRRRFTLSEAKTEFMCSSTRQVVTQLVVNDVLDVREEYVRMVHGIVVDLERRASSGYRPSSREMQSLRGRISFIQSINPSSASPLWRDLHRLKATRCLLS